MSSSRKIFLVFASVVFLSLIFGNVAFAQRPLEVQYPSVPAPGVPVPVNSKTALPDYIKYIFTLSITIAGLIAFGSLVYGGIRYATSVGNPSTMSDAQGQMFAGILGLVILISSYLILATINPQLIILKAMTQPTFGVILTNANSEQQRVGVSQSDLSSFNPTSIKFLSAGQVEVTVYDAPNYQGNSAQIATDGSLPPSGLGQIKSISLAWLSPGVYLYGSSNQDQFWTDTSVPLLSQFNDRAQRIKFVGGPNNVAFAAILHEDAGYQGQCRIFLSDNNNVQGSDAYGSVNGVSSATVFIRGNPNSGSSVTLCKQPDYQDCAAAYTNPIETPQFVGWDMNDQTRSIQIQGNYLAILMENAPGKGNFPGKCEVFNQRSVSDLKNEPIGMCDVNCFMFWCDRKPCTSGIAIYPVK